MPSPPSSWRALRGERREMELAPFEYSNREKINKALAAKNYCFFWSYLDTAEKETQEGKTRMMMMPQPVVAQPVVGCPMAVRLTCQGRKLEAKVSPAESPPGA